MAGMISLFSRNAKKSRVRARSYHAAIKDPSFPNANDSNDKSVLRGTQRWIDEFVIHHGICPFAAKSDYRFHIFPGNQVDQDTIVFFQHHVQETGEIEASRYSSFLLFPYVTAFLQPERDDMSVEERGDVQFMQFYQEAIYLCDNYAGTPNMTFTEQRVTVMPFHPDFPRQQYKMQQMLHDEENDSEADLKSEARLHTTCAPFPTFHVLRDADLTEVRGKMDDDSRSRSVHSMLKRNDATAERLGLSKLQKMMADYQSELWLP